MVAMMYRFRLFLPAMLCIASQADAHAFLERAVPAAGSEMAKPPHQIMRRFSEGLEPSFSTIELRNALGAPVSIGSPHAAPGNDRELIADLPNLGSGRYSVIWHVTSVDTHKTEGSYQFTITP
jgi:methionine-rich copper-binding protein CopC